MVRSSGCFSHEAPQCGPCVAHFQRIFSRIAFCVCCCVGSCSHFSVFSLGPFFLHGPSGGDSATPSRSKGQAPSRSKSFPSKPRPKSRSGDAWCCWVVVLFRRSRLPPFRRPNGVSMSRVLQFCAYRACPSGGVVHFQERGCFWRISRLPPAGSVPVALSQQFGGLVTTCGFHTARAS